ncbi:hypothetical protein LSM04_004793, partial [Trypanosoma melophagium]|uniref:uncharacterized protein n=1 Tax=Trypanosoma melophagium TaxID=715481 RepID=UPI00351A3F8D
GQASTTATAAEAKPSPFGQAPTTATAAGVRPSPFGQASTTATAAEAKPSPFGQAATTATAAEAKPSPFGQAATTATAAEAKPSPFGQSNTQMGAGILPSGSAVVVESGKLLPTFNKSAFGLNAFAAQGGSFVSNPTVVSGALSKAKVPGESGFGNIVAPPSGVGVVSGGSAFAPQGSAFGSTLMVRESAFGKSGSFGRAVFGAGGTSAAGGFLSPPSGTALASPFAGGSATTSAFGNSSSAFQSSSLSSIAGNYKATPQFKSVFRPQ